MGYKRNRVREMAGPLEVPCKCGRNVFSMHVSSFEQLAFTVMDLGEVTCECGRVHDVRRRVEDGLKALFHFDVLGSVHVTRSGSLFHKASCGYLSRSTYTKEGKAGALWEFGYDPCRCVMIRKKIPPWACCIYALCVVIPVLIAMIVFGLS